MSLRTTEDQVQPGGPEEPPTVSASRWLGLAIVLIATFMAMLDGFIVNVAIPSIQHDLLANPTEIELIGSAYSLPYALLVITGGRLGDLFGIRRLFLTGIVLFTGFSALCAAAPNPVLLIAARIGQACGGALLYPQVLSFIQVSFQEKERAQALSLWGAVVGLASIFGQLIGGSLITANVAGLGWRSAFLVNVPLGVIVLLGAWAFVFDHRKPRRTSLDLVGTILVAGGLLLLLYPIVEGRSAGWPWWMILCLPLALLVLVGFGWFERRVAARKATPLIDPSIFRLASFLWGCFLALVWCVNIAAFFFILALYLQSGIGFSPLLSGLAFIPIGISFIVAAAVSSQLMTRLGNWTFALALGSATAGTFGLFIAAKSAGSMSPGWLPLCLTFAFIGFGLGLGGPTVMTFALADIPEQEAGSASGIMETMMQLGFALGAPLIGLVFFNMSREGTELVRDVAQGFTQSMLYLGCSLVILLALTPFLVRFTRKKAQKA